MKKKIKDLTLEECNNICKQYDMCNSECPFWTSKGCKKLIDTFYNDAEVEVEVEERKELTPLEAVEKLKQYWDNHLPLSRPQGLKIVSIIESALKEQEEKTDLDNSLEILNIKTREDLYLMIKTLAIIKIYFYLEDFQDFITINGRLPKNDKEAYDTLIKGFETWRKKQH